MREHDRQQLGQRDSAKLPQGGLADRRHCSPTLEGGCCEAQRSCCEDTSASGQRGPPQRPRTSDLRAHGYREPQPTLRRQGKADVRLDTAAADDERQKPSGDANRLPLLPGAERLVRRCEWRRTYDGCHVVLHATRRAQLQTSRLRNS